jgi:dihydroorotase
MELLIKGARVIDAATATDKTADILVKDGVIAKVAEHIKSPAVTTIEAQGLVALPGLIDMHTHLRQPGREDEETIHTGQQAAVKGGFSCVAAMANTSPAIDNEGMVKFVYEEAAKTGLIDVLPVAAITKARAGEELTEMIKLAQAGAVAFSDDGGSVKNSMLMRRALEYAKMTDKVVISHCEDPYLKEGGLVNEGVMSTKLGLAPIPREAEIIMVSRDIWLAHLTGARLHIAHVSTKEALALIRQAKAQGIRVTCETCPHYFTLTDERLSAYDTRLKVSPPIRTAQDVEAVMQGLKDGTIDVIASDHAPHTSWEKDVEFERAAFGMVGLETTLGLVVGELVGKKVLSLHEVAQKLSYNPAKILGLNKGSLEEKKDADILLLNQDKEWTVDSRHFLSKSKNTPFDGWRLKGAPEYVIAKGAIVLNKGKVVHEKNK